MTIEQIRDGLDRIENLTRRAERAASPVSSRSPGPAEKDLADAKAALLGQIYLTLYPEPHADQLHE